MSAVATISQPPSQQLQADFRAFLATSPRIILGTQSSSRRAIMDELAAEYGFQYTCEVAGIDEEAIRHPEPAQLVLMLARAKAAAILAKLADAVCVRGYSMNCAVDYLDGCAATQVPDAAHTYLITCDQVVLYDGQIREKPTSAEQVCGLFACVMMMMIVFVRPGNG